MRRLLWTLTLAASALAQGPHAVLKTSLGEIEIELYPREAPQTVANFINLASGIQPWTDPNTRQTVRRPLYDGTVFHRVAPGQFIQGGDPGGSGLTGPGYNLPNETSALKFDQPGRMAMAKSGNTTNGSQFFITVAALPSLNGRFAVFGQVVRGLDVVRAINIVKLRGERPTDPVRVLSIRIKKSE